MSQHWGIIIIIKAYIQISLVFFLVSFPILESYPEHYITFSCHDTSGSSWLLSDGIDNFEEKWSVTLQNVP